MRVTTNLDYRRVIRHEVYLANWLCRHAVGHYRMISLCAQDVKAACDLLTAIFALLAAGAWFVAARHPVGVPGASPYMPADPNHPLWGEMKAHGKKICLGAKWNQIAAVLAGLSALATFLSWLVAKCYT